MAEENHPFVVAGITRKDPRERAEEMHPQLSDQALSRITAYGSSRRVEEGDILFDIGDHHANFIVLVSGKLAIEVDGCEDTTTIVKHGRGSFSGEIDMFSNRRAVARGTCTEAGEMAFLDRTAFRKMIASNADLSELIIRAFIY